MQGFPIAEQGHVVVPIYPRDLTGGQTGIRFNTKGAGHVTIIVALGAQAGAMTAIIINAATAQGVGAGSKVAIPFSYYPALTTLNDVIANKVAVAATGIAPPAATASIFYVIEVDTRQMPDGNPYLEVAITNAAQSCLGACIAILSGERFQNVPQDTALT